MLKDCISLRNAFMSFLYDSHNIAGFYELVPLTLRVWSSIVGRNSSVLGRNWSFTHTHTHTHKHTQTHKKHTYTYTNTHTQMHTQTNTHTHKTHTQTHTNAHTHTQTHTHTKHTYTHTHKTHKHTQMHTYKKHTNTYTKHTQMHKHKHTHISTYISLYIKSEPARSVRFAVVVECGCDNRSVLSLVEDSDSGWKNRVLRTMWGPKWEEIREVLGRWIMRRNIWYFVSNLGLQHWLYKLIFAFRGVAHNQESSQFQPVIIVAQHTLASLIITMIMMMISDTVRLIQYIQLY